MEYMPANQAAPEKKEEEEEEEEGKVQDLQLQLYVLH